ncbi:hypothetical protein HY745_03705 [Candidatus Desantisbacteria bacterium]|nr:hypothetical protein [Candidatus Desantisbacteria bacterium]
MENNSKTGTTAYNKPCLPMIHYSGKGYNEYRAMLIKKLQDKGFTLRDDDFINAFIDLTAYLGEVLMTYQNAYAQEIFLETAKLRESIFDLAYMVDYRISPGSAATAMIMIKAKEGKSGIIPKGFLISGKEENAREQVFFETNDKLYIDSKFNEFMLAKSERFKTSEIQGKNIRLTVLNNIFIKQGQYIFKSKDTEYLFAQVKSVEFNEKDKATSIQCAILYLEKTLEQKITLDGDWSLMSDAPCGILKIDSDGKIWLDSKYKNISKEAPVIILNGSLKYYGIINDFGFDTKKIMTGEVSTEINQDQSPNSGEELSSFYFNTNLKIEIYYAIGNIGSSTITRIAKVGTPEANLGVNEEIKAGYPICTDPGEVPYYVHITKNIKSCEVNMLAIKWLPNDESPNYPPEYSNEVKSPTHIVFIGKQTPLKIKAEEKENTDPLTGTELTVDKDISKLEKYRTLILRENAGSETEEVTVIDIINNNGTSTLKLKDPIKGDFTKNGVRIYGNIIKVTQGKTMPETIIGSSQGEKSYQTFEIPLSPLTFERLGGEGVKGAIDVKVNGLKWQSKDDFLYSSDEDNHYVIETDYEGKSRIIFGDGINGIRPGTGKNNISARFRVGQGAIGNVSAGVLKKPLSKPPFLQEVSNPFPSIGGTNPDKEEELREKIPTQHITFERAVSLMDYAFLALSYSCIVNQLLVINNADKISIKIAISVTVNTSDEAEKMKIRDKICQILGPGVNDDGSPQIFNYKRIDMGMSIFKKDIYRLIENIPGIRLINELTLGKEEIDSEDPVPKLFDGDIRMNNWELPVFKSGYLNIIINEQINSSLCECIGE